MMKPKKWKMALLTWVCIYPLINIVFMTVMPLVASWHILLRTLITTIILVPLMGISIDLLCRRVGDWIYK